MTWSDSKDVHRVCTLLQVSLLRLRFVLLTQTLTCLDRTLPSSAELSLGGEFRNKHVRKEQTCVSDLDEITKFPRHVVTWSCFNLCFLLSSSSSVCFIVLPVLLFCFILYTRGIFPKEIALSGMQPWGSSSCDRRRKPGADGRIEEWDEWVMGGRADVWGPPCLPTMSSSLPPSPPPFVRLSLPDFLASLCASCFFFSLSVSLLLLFPTAPSPHYFPRSLAPSLAPVCFNSCICIFSTAALVLPSCRWLELSRNVDLPPSVGLILPVILSVPSWGFCWLDEAANKVCGHSCVSQKHCILWSNQRTCVYTMWI